MSDEAKDPDTEDEGPVGGERLRAARRAKDISIRDVAKELHLDEAKVRALEQNDFDVLGAPVFAKGHLRKYAGLVGVSADDVMTDYYKMTRAAGAPPIVGPVRKRPRDINPGPWIIGILAATVLGAGAYWWFVMRAPAEPLRGSRTISSQQEPATVVEQQAEEGTARESAAGTVTAAPDGAAGTDATPTGVDETAAVAAPADSEAPDTSPPSDDESLITLRLTFNGDCWTEVSDANGERLFYDLGAAGRVVTVSGEAPVRVILGDAGNVSLSVDGRDYPIPDSAVRGRLARLTINAN